MGFLYGMTIIIATMSKIFAPNFLKELGCRQIQKEVSSSLMRLWSLPMRVVLLALVLVAFCSVFHSLSLCTVSVSDVETIREGHQSEVLLSIADEFPADRCFTLVFRGRRGNLDLVAESAEEAQSWIRGMRKLIENLENMGERERLDQYLLLRVWRCCWPTVCLPFSPQNHRWVLMCPFRNILHLMSTCLYVNIQSQRYIIKNCMILLQTSKEYIQLKQSTQ